MVSWPQSVQPLCSALPRHRQGQDRHLPPLREGEPGEERKLHLQRGQGVQGWEHHHQPGPGSCFEFALSIVGAVAGAEVVKEITPPMMLPQ